MSIPILATKLYTPHPPPNLVRRPRLIERLNVGLRRTPSVTLVSAPAGFGKTTLVSDWLSGVERPSTWLSLDESDNDPVRFLFYLVAALQRVDSNMGQAVQSAIGSTHPLPVDWLVTTLINDIAARPEPFALVLDDYHAIHIEQVHEVVESLITHQPPQLHLILLTRVDPPLPLPRLRVRGQLTEIYADDLRFTGEEAAAFLNHALRLTLETKVVTALEARSEGWVAALQLAALSMQGRSVEHMVDFVEAFTGSHRHVIDYLADEVLAQQPGEIRDFLRQTAILDRITAPLCDALTGRDDSGALLRQLEQANLFLIPLDDQREWYRYHRLFADFLRTELDRESQAALHLKAAGWLADHDLLPEAVEHALASRDMNEAARMITLAAEGAFRTASFATLLGWLNVLPDKLVRSNGELATYKGFLLFSTRQYVGAATYADAAEGSLPPDAPLPSRGRLLSLKAQIALYNGSLDSAIHLSKETLAWLGDGDTFFRSLTLNVLGQIMQMQGDIAEAADVYRDAVQIERQAGNQPGAVQLANLVFALNELGRRREALALYRDVVEDSASQPGWPSPLAEASYFVWSLLSFEANELDLAREQVVRALDLCQQMNFTDGIFLSHYFLAQVNLASGRIDAMQQVIYEVRQYVAQLNLDLPYEPWLAALEAQASLHQGDIAAARRWAEATGLTPADTPDYWVEPVYLTYVRLLLSQNRPEEARTVLVTLERSAQKGGRRRKLITIYLQQALVQQALRHKEQALARIEDALRLAVPEGYRRAFLDEGQGILDLLPQVRAHLGGAIAQDFVDQVLSAAGVEPVTPRAQALVEPLSERELQVLRLLAAGLSSTEVAQELTIAVGTVRTHIKNIYGKLGVHSRVEAVVRAQELGLI